MDDAHDWVDWGGLEQLIPLDDLPRFHRAFLTLNKPEEDWEEATLRKVQGKVQASLKQLERDGLAKTKGERFLVAKRAIPESFQSYVDEV